MKQDTTVAAFTAMIKFIYDCPDYLSGSPTPGYQELADLLAIARIYRVKRLEDQVEKMIEEVPVAQRKNGEGNALFSVKNYAAAITTYQEALANVGDDETEAWLRSQIITNIGVCQFELGRYKEALESFSEAMAKDPTGEEPFLKMSGAMEKRFEKVKLGEQTEKETEEIARYRSEADIIVYLSQTAIRMKVRRQVVYNDLGVALMEANYF